MTTKKSTTTEVVEEPVVEPAVKKETKIYVGPTIPGVVKNNTVFNNGVDDRVTERIKQQPELKGLLIDINNLSDAQRQITLRKGAYYSLFSKIKGSLKEE